MILVTDKVSFGLWNGRTLIGLHLYFERPLNVNLKFF